ncbi:MAG: HAD-IIIA family hydrolase [Candidatus Wallbacteria bacterium]|nr:HAD-IIIA family hydrolase [Candidatus Wallbacteria bacterium]
MKPSGMAAKYKKIKALILDVDGVLTDGLLYFSDAGESFKAFNVQDGLGIAVWRSAGYKVFIITGRKSRIVKRRADDLQIDGVFQGVGNKLEALKLICRQHELNLQELAYVGDDLNDLSALLCCGVSLAPRQAVPEVKNRVDHVLARAGGSGAVREAIELILKKKGTWDKVLEHFETGPEERTGK